MSICRLTGGPGIECRNTSGTETLVFTFSNDVVSGNATVTSGTGTAGAPTFATNTMTVPLTGVTDVQRLTVTLTGVTDTSAQVLADTPVTMGVLIGDAAGDWQWQRGSRRCRLCEVEIGPNRRCYQLPGGRGC